MDTLDVREGFKRLREEANSTIDHLLSIGAGDVLGLLQVCRAISGHATIAASGMHHLTAGRMMTMLAEGARAKRRGCELLFIELEEKYRENTDPLIREFLNECSELLHPSKA